VEFEKMKEEFRTPWLYALIPCQCLEKREFGKNENSINLNDQTLQDLQYIYCTAILTLEVKD
jgi:hypothetical protein